MKASPIFPFATSRSGPCDQPQSTVKSTLCAFELNFAVNNQGHSVVRRPAWEDAEGGTRNFHDASHLTFHRMADFRHRH